MSDAEALIGALETLELPHRASLKEIRAQYRRLALAHHPDRNPGGGGAGHGADHGCVPPACRLLRGVPSAVPQGGYPADGRGMVVPSFRCQYVDLYFEEKRMISIAIASGKGGTGKTFIATNLAVTLQAAGRDVTYLDCDVEAPNGHLFLRPDTRATDTCGVLMPAEIDSEACTGCGRCVEVCRYNALALVKGKVLLFPELCHACGACTLVCPAGAVSEKELPIGDIHHGTARGTLDFHDGLVRTGAGGMSPRVIKALKKHVGRDITILDAPPGTACPVVVTLEDVDLCVLVTDPTPFGIHDLTLAVGMCRAIGQEPAVLINRGGGRQERLRQYLDEAQLGVLGELPDDRQVAEVYSSGGMVVDVLSAYRPRFEAIAAAVLARAAAPRRPAAIPAPEAAIADVLQKAPASGEGAGSVRELVVLSGKGGTGKTSVAGSFAVCAGTSAIADCDVDAADLHLLLQPTVQRTGSFSGGIVCAIDPDLCTGCGRCLDECRFHAITHEDGTYQVSAVGCEGCGVCLLVCPAGAVSSRDAINGRWFVSKTRCGPMAHAALGFAEENSGKLVTLVRNNAAEAAGEDGTVIIDGSPGTGCPVIASLTGARYALMVTEPTVSGLHDLERILDLARHFRVPAGVVVNKDDINPAMTERIREKTAAAGADWFGGIPYDTAVTEAQVEGRTLVEHAPSSPAAAAVRSLWDRVRERAGLKPGKIT